MVYNIRIPKGEDLLNKNWNPKTMDIKEVPVPQLRGLCVLFSAPMNGGKTEGLVSELRRAWYYDLNSIAYNHKRNTRERNSIVIDGREPFPAKTVSGIPELRTDLEMRMRLIESDQIQHNANGGTIIIDGIEHRKHLPLAVVGIDEVNLFCLNEKEAQETIEFIFWCSQNNVALYLAGLPYDFRHRPFGQVHALAPYINLRQERKPACMAITPDGHKCTHTATHTQRLWHMDVAAAENLGDVLGQMRYFGFVHKDKTPHQRSYVAAPFFDRTVRIEDAASAGLVYLPVCTPCARLPFRDETFVVYDAIVRGSLETDLLPEPIQDKIVQFLVTEGWVQDREGTLTARPYYQNRVGTFSPPPNL